jgi:SAM-dependent methyltransferase
MLDGALAEQGGRCREILDIGCGTGTMVIHLGRYGRVFGVDMDNEAVGYCRDRGLDTVMQASAGKLPFGDDAFDLVTMLDVLEHISDEGAALAEAARVIRPGGLFMVAVPAYRFLWGAQDEASQHQRRYRAKQLERRVRESGLHVKRLTHFNTILFPPIAAIRLMRRAWKRPRSLRSDFTFPAPPAMNAVLAAVFGWEADVVARANLPFGVSILCLAEKPMSQHSALVGTRPQ